MSDLIVTEFVSLDGVMEAPGGEPTHPHTGWTIPYHGPEQIEYKFQEMLDAEVHLIGRVTYESFAGAWPTYEGPFADRMNSMPKVVVSSTLTDPAWNNTTVLAGRRWSTASRALKERRRRSDPRRRQRHPGPHAARRRTGRRAPPDGVPGEHRRRRARASRTRAGASTGPWSTRARSPPACASTPCARPDYGFGRERRVHTASTVAVTSNTSWLLCV